MKNFMKSCGITALILILVGLALSVTAGSVKGTTALRDVVDDVTNGMVQLNLGDLNDWGITIGEEALRELEANVNYNIEDSMNFDNDFEILEGNVDKYSLVADIKELDVEVGGCSFKMETSSDENFYLEANSINKLQGYVEEQVLYIKGTIGTGVIDNLGDGEITLYVPENFQFEKVDMELGAGAMELGNLAAKEAKLEVGAGQIVVSDMQGEKVELTVGMGEILVNGMQVQELEAEVDMGHMYAEGDITAKVTIECNMGSIEMEVTGEWMDFDYNLECGMGNLQVGDDVYSGVATEKIITNMADKEMDVECAMGNIQISFTE